LARERLDELWSARTECTPGQADAALVVLDEIEQQVEHLRLHRLRFALHPKLTACRVQFELVKNDRHAGDFQKPR
jgi:hypothetical protein